MLFLTLFIFIQFSFANELCQYNNERIVATTTVLISFCSFKHINSNSYGGVVNCQTSGMTITCNQCNFVYCGTSGQGGVFYVITKEIFFDKMCGSHCYAQSQCHFAYLSSSVKLSLDYLSIQQCYNNSQQSTWYNLYIVNGQHVLQNTNSSKNIVYMTSSFLIEYETGLQSTHNTFASNAASFYTCVYFYGGSGTRNLDHSIFHNNSVPSSTYGVVLLSGSAIEISNTQFSSNSYTLLYVYSGTLTITSCQFQHDYPLTQGSVIGSIVTTASIADNYIFIHHQCFPSISYSFMIPKQNYIYTVFCCALLLM